MSPLLRHNCLFDKGRLTISQLLLQLRNKCLKWHWNTIRATQAETFYQLPLCFYEQLWPIYWYWCVLLSICTLMVVMCQLLGDLYLQCCITGTDVSVFSLELFNTLHQGFVSCSELIFLLLQPRCQVFNLTLQSTRVMKENLHLPPVCVDFLNIKVCVCMREMTDLCNNSTWASSLLFSSVICSFCRLLESLSERALASWASCLWTKRRK